MSILVAGCGGFIGSNVSRLLVESGHCVTGLDIVHPCASLLVRGRLRDIAGKSGFAYHTADSETTKVFAAHSVTDSPVAPFRRPFTSRLRPVSEPAWRIPAPATRPTSSAPSTCLSCAGSLRSAGSSWPLLPAYTASRAAVPCPRISRRIALCLLMHPRKAPRKRCCIPTTTCTAWTPLCCDTSQYMGRVDART